MHNNQQNEPKKCGLSLGERTWAGTYFGDPGTPIAPRGDRVLPSILLSSIAGEPPRLDDLWPPHNRGIGGDWPPEARVNAETGSGRFPLAAVITGLPQRYSWCWNYGEREHQLEAAAALGIAAASIVKRHADSGSVLTIPNWLKEDDQQLILDNARRYGSSLQLLWQPIAAAISYLEDHLHVEEGNNSFLHVHCSWDLVTLTRLSIVHQEHEGETFTVPARRRPSFIHDTAAGFGWGQIDSVLRNHLPPGRFDSSWGELFANRKYVKSEHLFDSSEPDLVGDLKGPNCHYLPGQDWTIDQQKVSDARRWLCNKINKMKNLKAVVVTGDGAAALTELGELSKFNAIDYARNLSDKTSMFLNAVSKADCNIENVNVFDGIHGEHYLAQGAALFGYRSERGLPTYRDTLPKMDLLLEVGGDLQWTSLLDEKIADVEGGRIWHRPEPITGLSVQRGQESITLPVFHEEYETIRDLTFHFPYTIADRVPAELYVSAAPASGHARLELKFPEGGIKGHSTVLADWRRMADTGMDREKYLDSQPRAFPETMPRESSPKRWKRAIPDLQDLADRIHNKKRLDKWKWEHVKKQVMQKDTKFYLKDSDGKIVTDPKGNKIVIDATAVGSEGVGPGNSKKALQAGHVLREAVMHQPFGARATAIRILGYISYEHAGFEKWLVKNIGGEADMGSCILHTCGLCLRNPKHIKTFFERIVSRGVVGGREKLLKSISHVLRYRGDATHVLNSDFCCNKLMNLSLDSFKKQMDRGGHSLEFRWAALIVVFLLRRRMYDSTFFDPESKQALLAKKLFQTAIERHKRGILRPMRGSVNVPVALQQMIDYIDKKGVGLIQMANEEGAHDY